MRTKSKQVKKNNVPGEEGQLFSWNWNDVCRTLVRAVEAFHRWLDPTTGTDLDADGNPALGDKDYLTRALDAASKQLFYTDYGTVNAIVLKRKMRDIDPLNEDVRDLVLEQILDSMTFFFTPFAANTSQIVTIQLNEKLVLDDENVFEVFTDHDGTRPDLGFFQRDKVYIAIFDKTLNTNKGGYIVHMLTSIAGGGGNNRQPYYANVNIQEADVNGVTRNYLKLITDQATGGYIPYTKYFPAMTVVFEFHSDETTGLTYLEVDNLGDPDRPTKAVLFNKNVDGVTQGELDQLHANTTFGQGRWYFAVYVPATIDTNGDQLREHFFKIYRLSPSDYTLVASNPEDEFIKNQIGEEVAPGSICYVMPREVNFNRVTPLTKNNTNAEHGVRINYQFAPKWHTAVQAYEGDQARFDKKSGKVGNLADNQYLNGLDGGIVYDERGSFRIFLGSDGLQPTGTNGKFVHNVSSLFVRNDGTYSNAVGLSSRLFLRSIDRVYFFIPYKHIIGSPNSVLSFKIWVNGADWYNAENTLGLMRTAWWQAGGPLSVSGGTGYIRPQYVAALGTTFPVYAMYQYKSFFVAAGFGDKVIESNGSPFRRCIADLDTSYELDKGSLDQDKINILSQWLNKYNNGEGFIGCLITKTSVRDTANYTYVIEELKPINSEYGLVDINYEAMYVSPW